MTPDDPIVVCYACGLVVREGAEPPSHGLCPACLPRVQAEWNMEPEQGEA